MGSGWAARVSRILESKAFRVTWGEERLMTLDGGFLRRGYLRAFYAEGGCRVSVFEEGGYLKVFIVAGPGYKGLHSLVEAAERLGLDVEVDDVSGRVMVSFKAEDAESLGDALNAML